MTTEDELRREVAEIVEAANVGLALRCEEAGIPAEMVPTIYAVWASDSSP